MTKPVGSIEMIFSSLTWVLTLELNGMGALRVKSGLENVSTARFQVKNKKKHRHALESYCFLSWTSLWINRTFVLAFRTLPFSHDTKRAIETMIGFHAEWHPQLGQARKEIFAFLPPIWRFRKVSAFLWESLKTLKTRTILKAANTPSVFLDGVDWELPRLLSEQQHGASLDWLVLCLRSSSNPPYSLSDPLLWFGSSFAAHLTLCLGWAFITFVTYFSGH